ncbi:MAG: hypothetical protein ACRCZP_17350 [Phycicoccus sp.]
MTEILLTLDPRDCLGQAGQGPWYAGPHADEASEDAAEAAQAELAEVYGAAWAELVAELARDRGYVPDVYVGSDGSQLDDMARQPAELVEAAQEITQIAHDAIRVYPGQTGEWQVETEGGAGEGPIEPAGAQASTAGLCAACVAGDDETAVLAEGDAVIYRDGPYIDGRGRPRARVARIYPEAGKVLLSDGHRWELSSIYRDGGQWYR